MKTLQVLNLLKKNATTGLAHAHYSTTYDSHHPRCPQMLQEEARRSTAEMWRPHEGLNQGRRGVGWCEERRGGGSRGVKATRRGSTEVGGESVDAGER